MSLNASNRGNYVDSALFLSPPGNWVGVVGAMKPGSHLLLFSNVNEHHVGAIAAEDAGLEIRDTLAWVFSDESNDTAMQLIAMARKPLQGTVAENVLRWGVGGLNIKACRIGTKESLNGGAYTDGRKPRAMQPGGGLRYAQTGEFNQPEGRWPANLIHSGDDPVVELFPSPHGAGEKRSGGLSTCQSKGGGLFGMGGNEGNGMMYGDSGSAGRFFYSAPSIDNLVAYLLKLVTPENGTVFTNCNTDSLPKEYNYVTDPG